MTNELEKKMDQATEAALTDSLDPPRSIPRPAMQQQQPRTTHVMSTAGLVGSASMQRPMPSKRLTTIEHLQHAVDALRQAEAAIVELGVMLIGAPERGKPVDPTNGYERPFIGHVHIAADEVAGIAASIRREVDRIKEGL